MQHDYFHEAERKRILHHTNSRERGLLNYEKCSIYELHRFIFDRQLALPYGAILPFEVPFDQAVALLEAADNHLTFHGLTQLPAELQSQIFELYLCSLGPLSTRPELPPLALVSKWFYFTVRPLFYTCCIFPVLSIQVSPWQQDSDLCHFSDILNTWTPVLKHADQAILSTIRRLAIHVYRLTMIPQMARRVPDEDAEPCVACWLGADTEEPEHEKPDPECEICFGIETEYVKVNVPHARWIIDLGDSWRPVELRRAVRVNDMVVFGEHGVGRKNWRHYEDDIWWGADWQEHRVMSGLEQVQAAVASRWGDRKFEPRTDVQKICTAITAGYSPRVL